MDFRFSTRDDGQIDAAVVGEFPILDHALADAISSLPPRGASSNGPSTYWIDATLEKLESSLRSNSDLPFASGNVSMLRLCDGVVEARYDYDDDAQERDMIAVSDLVAMLEQWRDRVIESARSATSPLPETYRRNPAQPAAY